MHERPAAPKPDPLYDPPLLVFVWTAWAAASTWIDDRTGLWVLVAATALLTGVAVRRHRPPEQRPFIVDFGVILLFCANAIAVGVLLVSTTAGGRFAIGLASAVLVGLAATSRPEPVVSGAPDRRRAADATVTLAAGPDSR